MQLVDVAMTKRAIPDLSAEANPIVRTIAQHGGWASVIGLKLGLVVVLAFCWSYKHFDKVLIAFCAVYCLLTFYHFFLL